MRYYAEFCAGFFYIVES